jgi:phosphomannomutase
VTTDTEAWARHLQRLLELPILDVALIRERGFRVAVDCVHGAGGPPIQELLEALGCDVVGIGMEPDGRFPRDPEPTADNLAELGELVRKSGAAIGLGIDPDVDRLSLVDETGTPMGEDLTLALASAAVLSRTPGPVVTNLSTSQVVEDVARSFDVPLVRAPVGEVNVARRMQAERAVVGGEGNGGVILSALHHTRDAPLAVALVLQHVADEQRTPSEARGPLAHLYDREREGVLPPGGARGSVRGARGGSRRGGAGRRRWPPTCMAGAQCVATRAAFRHRAGRAAHRRSCGRRRSARAGAPCGGCPRRRALKETRGGS